MPAGVEVKRNDLVDYWFDEVKPLLSRAVQYGDLPVDMFKAKFLIDEWMCITTGHCVFVGYPLLYKGERSFWVVFETGDNYINELPLFMDYISQKLMCKNMVGLISYTKARLYRARYPHLHSGAVKTNHEVIDLYKSNYLIDINPKNHVEYLQTYNIECWWEDFTQQTRIGDYTSATGVEVNDLKQMVYNNQWTVLKIGTTWIVAKIAKNILRKEFVILFVSGESVRADLATCLRQVENKLGCRYVSFESPSKYAKWVNYLAKRWKTKITSRLCYSYKLF